MSGLGSPDSSAARSGGFARRRRSLLYRITDTITSFIPSLFEPRQTASSGQNNGDLQSERPAKRPRTSKASLIDQSSSLCQTTRLSVSRVGTVDVPSTSLTAPIDADVDLDARDDGSDFSVGSKTSVSTSGVSSLLPRSFRSEHNLVKPSPMDNSSDYTHQKNCSNTRKRENTELWVNHERTGHYSSDSPSMFKRMRSDNSESSVTTLNSPFYRGRVSYGGAASLRPTNRTRSVFEHITPLRFILESDEEEKPKPKPQPAFLSATAQSILQSLEKHGSKISSSDKIPLPKSIPFSPLSSPLQRSTTRYPSYLATYNRYKEFKKQSSAAHPLLSTPDTQLPTSVNSVGEKDENNATPKADIAVTSKTPLFDFTEPSKLSTSSSQTTESLSLLTTSEKPQLGPLKPNASILKAKKNVEIESVSHRTSEISTVRFDTNIQYEKESESDDANKIFTFSSPISLNLLSRPPVNTSESQLFAFSKPKSQFKKALPAERSSFLPTLLSQRQSFASDKPNAANRTIIPLDLSLWRCESCLTENSERDGVCKSCHMPNISSSDQKPLSSEKVTFLQIPPSAFWECPTCLVRNKVETSSCVCCQTLNPSGKVDIDALNESSTVAPTFDFRPPKSTSSAVSLSSSSTRSNSRSGCDFNAPLSQTSTSSISTWECPCCLVSNDDSREKCICCATAKPIIAASSVKKPKNTYSGFNFGSNFVAKDTTPTSTGFLFGSDSTKNPNSSIQFGTPVSCCSSSLGSESENSDKPQVGAQSSLDKWECPSCLVRNAASRKNCVCCRTTKPGSDGFSTPKAFEFGASLSGSPPVHSGFVFGNASISTAQFSAVPSANASTVEFGKVNGKKWQCPSCTVSNDDALDSCLCCGVKKSTFTADPKNDSISWECPSCMVKNDLNVNICQCCQTKKPSPTDTSSKENEWDCSSCLGLNAASALKCVHCASLKPDISANDSLKTSDSSSTSSAGSPPVIMSAVKSSFTSRSQTAASSFSSPFKFGELAKTSVSSSVGPPFFFPKQTESGVDSSFKLGYKPATFSQPVIPTGPASLKNGGFQFSFSTAASTFDFNAKKENLTPASSSNTPLTSFGVPTSSTESSLILKSSEAVPPPINTPAIGLFNFDSPRSESGAPNFSAAGTSSQGSGLNGRPIRRAVRRQRE